MGDIFQQLFSQSGILFLVKIVLLVVIGMVFMYAFILMTQVQSLKRIVFIEKAYGSQLVTLLAILYVIATLVLFLVTLAIL